MRLWLLIPESARDALWPTLTPLTVEERDELRRRSESRLQTERDLIAALPDDVQVLTTALADAQRTFDAEESRRASVESRLTTVLGMTSIASAIAFGALAALNGSQLEVRTWTLIAASVVTAYAAAQLTCALLAAVRGLSRRSYPLISVSNLLRMMDEDAAAHARRIVRTYADTTEENREVDSTKVSELAVAHTALRNFIVAALGLTVFLSIVNTASSTRGLTQGQIIRSLRADSAFFELLRGPRGPSGPQDLPGQRGPPGTQAAGGMDTVKSRKP